MTTENEKTKNKQDEPDNSEYGDGDGNDEDVYPNHTNLRASPKGPHGEPEDANSESDRVRRRIRE